ncbi:6-phosphofructokinase [Geothermobacter hydrogeniphilus]|uniref:ATP-dependent 6-phosphofructokinase n=1 Tax=Geothermobacter hydrogeniphilus TaxID=1969733 RepID=A0A2K2H812_9BACT|nr:6-phosphofructokinase [Geothermobacter hydrogeniphilus]PNU19445.1 6-phosphofructokinase [Geothermobacter hydrogeniphilus]
MKRIAVLTSGGDCSGMNAALRAVVRTAMNEGIEVVGIHRGFKGLIDRQYEIMQNRSVSNILQRGGTILQSARCKEMLTTAGQTLAADTLTGLGVEGLVVIGGGGSLRGAQALAERGTQVIGIPASIDNDLPFTDMSLGVDTALNNILYAVDCLKDTASSHDRTFVVECMGRDSGYLALVSAVAVGAEFAIIPERPYDLEAICVNLRQRYQEGRINAIIMVAEGAGTAHDIAAQIRGRIGFETRVMVLGHYQRGGSPSAFDRLLAARFGLSAVESLLAGESGKMVGLSCSDIALTDFEQVLQAGIRPIDQLMVALSHKLS